MRGHAAQSHESSDARAFGGRDEPADALRVDAGADEDDRDVRADHGPPATAHDTRPGGDVDAFTAEQAQRPRRTPPVVGVQTDEERCADSGDEGSDRSRAERVLQAKRRE